MALFAGSAAPAHADPDALWQLVNDQCVPDLVQRADPAPCVAVDLSSGRDRGYAVLKDPNGPRQFLLVPTARIPGIESPVLLDPATPNYFAEAWRVRSFTEAAAGGALPREWVGIAVNSAVSRTQNQLHLHIDCLRADVHEALAGNAAAVGPVWAPFPVPLVGRHFSAIAVDAEVLDAHNPFRLLADGFPGAGADMGSHTMVVAGTRDAGGGPGFLILATRVDPADPFWGEDLQDHRACPPPLPAGPDSAK